ncbi:MAG: ComF family protein [Acidobacteriota bacterium]
MKKPTGRPRLAVPRRIGEALLAALFPADCLLCGRPLPWRQKGSVCLSCWHRLPWRAGMRRRPGPLDAVLWAADYDGAIRRLIRAFKFEGIDYLGRVLGEESASRVLPLLGSAVPRPDLVVPVPLHWWRRSRRGYDQALLLARALARRAGLPLAAGLLVRRRVGRQLGLSRNARLAALRGAYLVRGTRPGRGTGVPVEGRNVLLVDDVVTTGATLQACALPLRRAGARTVAGFAVARTPSRRGRGEGEG